MNPSEQDLIDMIAKNDTEPNINPTHRDPLREKALAAYDQRHHAATAQATDQTQAPRNPISNLPEAPL